MPRSKRMRLRANRYTFLLKKWIHLEVWNKRETYLCAGLTTQYCGLLSQSEYRASLWSQSTLVITLYRCSVRVRPSDYPPRLSASFGRGCADAEIDSSRDRRLFRCASTLMRIRDASPVSRSIEHESKREKGRERLREQGRDARDGTG